jgi:hypothetical protein
MKNLVYIIILAAAGLSGCEKLIQVDSPATQLGAETVFADEATTKAVLMNLYGSSINFLAGEQSSPTMQGALSGDETVCYSIAIDHQQVANGQISPSNTFAADLWNSAYQCIYNANLLLENLKDNPKLSENFRKQATGEALFFRAISHLTLTSFYGEVPLAISTDYRVNNSSSRVAQSKIWSQVIDDLSIATGLLPLDYSVSSGERIRVNSHAAKALLARANLYAGNNQQAEDLSSQIISSSNLFQLGLLNEAFLKSSKEAIFQIRTNSDLFSTSDGHQFVLAGRPSFIALRNDFIMDFEAGDQRLGQWIAKYTLGQESWYYPFKYKSKTSSAITEHSTVLRLAEVFLIRAEARARIDKLELASADLDIIRARAGLGQLSASLTQQQLLEQVLIERRSELFTEWAHRWIDLKRFGKADKVLTQLKAGWVPRAKLFPIPQSELNVNPKLGQNPGY